MTRLQEFASQNVERCRLLVEAVANLKAADKPVDFIALKLLLPDDFDLDSEHDPWRAIADGEIAGEMAATEFGDGLDDDTADELREFIRRNDANCAELRGELRALGERRGQARASLSEALSAYMHMVGPRVTQLDNTREFLRAQNQERVDRANGSGVAPRPIPGPSAIDRSAMYSGSAYGDASDTARRGFQNGGYRRGALDSSKRGWRLPSQG